MRWSLKKYRKLYKGPLPHITPQVLRHTFCTNMEDAGIDIKSLHYLMGHSDAGVTMNVYTHASFLKAEAAMAKNYQYERYERCEKQEKIRLKESKLLHHLPIKVWIFT